MSNTVASPQSRHTLLEPVDETVDHTRGLGERMIVEYGDYECPYSRRAYRAIQRVERQLGGRVRFAFRHFPLTEVHLHALAAAGAAEAAALQGQFWQMHDTLFHRQLALEESDLRRYALELGLDIAQFDCDRRDVTTLERIRRDVRSAAESGQVRGTPTLFLDGVVVRGGYDVQSLLRTLAE